MRYVVKMNGGWLSRVGYNASGEKVITIVPCVSLAKTYGTISAAKRAATKHGGVDVEQYQRRKLTNKEIEEIDDLLVRY